MQCDVIDRGSGGVKVLGGDVAAHGEYDHQGAEHGDRSAKPDHTDRRISFSIHYFYSPHSIHIFYNVVSVKEIVFFIYKKS